jgi:hypothetical protein
MNHRFGGDIHSRTGDAEGMSWLCFCKIVVVPLLLRKVFSVSPNKSCRAGPLIRGGQAHWRSNYTSLTTFTMSQLLITPTQTSLEVWEK